MTNSFLRKTSPVLLIVLLGACASAPQQQSLEPVADYRPDASYSMLMAEIALQRQAYLVTAQEYLNAAEQSADPEFAQRATEYAYEHNYDILALGGAQRWLELQPDNLLANEYAGRLYLRRNQLKPALTYWRASLGAGDLSRDEFLRVGADMADEQNPVGATYVLTRLVNERPAASGLRMALAYAALRAGAFDLSLASAEAVEVAEPDWIQPQLIIPKALLSMGREYEAFTYLDDALSARVSTTLELEYVRLLSAVGRHDEAMRRLLELGKLYGAQPELVRMHGLIAFAAGDLEAAEQDFEQLLSSGNHVYESYFTLGRIAMLLGEYRRAIGYFERIRGSAYLVRARLSISVAQETLGNEEAALELLQTFSEDYPRHALDVVGSEAQLLYRMGRVDEALALYENASRLRPDVPALMLEYGAMLDLAGRYKDAIRLMQRAAEIAPKDSNVLNTLGYTLANRTRRYDEAYRLIRMALELDPDSAAVIDSMGWVLYRKGRLDESLSYLELAMSQLEDPEIIAHLGEVLWASDEREQALATWDKGLIDYPDSQPLIETRQRFVP
ncbi:MAG: tetratricopeptide repeat protein [Gammaproteobacteria bacterium]